MSAVNATTHGYTPGLRITDRALIRRLRRLPLPGEIHVREGEEVRAEQLIGSTQLPGNVVNVNVAHELSMTPDDVPDYLLVEEGDEVELRQVIAESKSFWGLFHAIARAPISGTIETVSGVTGQVLIRGEPIQVQIDAYIDGVVVEVHGREAVVVETRGALAQGILGVGGEAHGVLRVLCDAPGQACTAELISDDCRDCVLVGGGRVTLDALMAAREAGVAAVVTGAIDDRDLDEFVGEPLGVAITGQEDLGLSLVLTEGFGDTPMRARTFELLAERDGRRASVNGATQIRAGVIRPEVVVPEPGATWEARDEMQTRGLAVGSPVRLIRPPTFGELAVIVELPEEPTQIETEARVRVARVRLDRTGEVIVVPRANMEIIEE
ncbi:MAG: hypothetical protein ACOX9R_02710 [Armatimonadota bacterium]|jgi:hypothetical protein